MRLYYEDDSVKLYHGDCREELPNLKAADALVLADPPYGQTSLAWDRWDGEWLRLIPSNIRAMWCFGSLRMFMANAADFGNGGWHLSQDVVWEKHNGSSFHSDRFRRVHEQACHFYRGEWRDIPKNTPTTPDVTKRTVRRKERPTHMGEIADSTYTSHDGGPRLMRSVIHVRSEHGHAFNETQKPLGILRPLIEYGSIADGMVIVPFAGAGSELVAAKQLGRKAIGFELREQQCDAAAERLRQEVMFFNLTTENTEDFGQGPREAQP